MTKKKIVGVLSVVLMFILANPLYSLDFDTYIKKFTKIVYPELDKKDQWISFEDINGPYSYIGPIQEMVVKIGMRKEDFADPRHPRLGILEPDFQAGFAFLKDGTLDAMSAKGKIIDALLMKRKKICDEIIDSSRPWSDQEIVDYLKAKGAKYGPQDKEAFLKSIPIMKLQELMGKVRIIQSVFEFRSETTVDQPPSLDWSVDLEIKTKRGWQKYWVSFEPFEGKLYCMGRVPVKYKEKGKKGRTAM